MEPQSKNASLALFEKLIPQALCEQMIAEFENGIPKERTYQGIVNKEHRDASFVTLSPHLEGSLLHFITPAIEAFYDVPMENCFVHPPLIFKYLKGVGFVPHHDMVTEIERQRGKANGQPVIGGDLSILVYPNEPAEYDGGELFFPETNESFKPSRGTVIVFPATENFVHGVRPILSGVRFSVLGRMNTK